MSKLEEIKSKFKKDIQESFPQTNNLLNNVGIITPTIKKIILTSIVAGAFSFANAYAETTENALSNTINEINHHQISRNLNLNEKPRTFSLRNSNEENKRDFNLESNKEDRILDLTSDKVDDKRNLNIDSDQSNAKRNFSLKNDNERDFEINSIREELKETRKSFEIKKDVRKPFSLKKST